MEGFEKFKKFEFNLCILDVMMPYKDGFTLATEIKVFHRYSHNFLTAVNEGRRIKRL